MLNYKKTLRYFWFAVLLNWIQPTFSLCASITGLKLWRLPGKETTLIIPEIEGEDSSVTARRYLEALNHPKSNYAEMLKGFNDNKSQITIHHDPGTGEPLQEEIVKDQFFVNSEAFSKDHFSSLPHFDIEREKVPLAVIANRPGHMSRNDPFFKNVYNGFTKGGSEVYIVPLGLETFLSKNQLQDYHNLISEKFPGLLALGGADIDPAHYQEKNEGKSKGTNFQRDQTELDLIRTYSKKEKGAFYGLCRGHQAYTVALGGKLNQDLHDPLNEKGEGIHKLGNYITDQSLRSAWHPIELIVESPLQGIFGTSLPLVNSRHHQAVSSPPPIEGVKVIAKEPADNRIDENDLHTIVEVEAIQRENKKGQIIALTVQFHPEDMHEDGDEKAAIHGRNFMKFVANNNRQFLPDADLGVIHCSSTQNSVKETVNFFVYDS